MARIDTLANFLTDVATAIKSKTGKTDSITPANFDTEINGIEVGGGKYAPKFCSFYYCRETDLTKEISLLDTSNITSMYSMFSYCTKVTNLDLSGFNTSQVTDMTFMFQGCSQLTSVDVSGFDTSNVTSMVRMFENCHKLTSLDLSSFHTPNLTACAKMFNSDVSTTCELMHIDMRNFDFTNVTLYTDMFTNVKTNCEIIVKDNTAKEWITSRFTTLTNVKTVAEYEAA